MDKKEYITNSLEETQSLGRELARTLRGGEIICLDGELGAGKTTFTQGLLAELGAEGPYTSPTFLIMKQYQIEIRNPKSEIRNNIKIQKSKSQTDLSQSTSQKLQTIYHIDAYRINEDDLLNLGWEEMLENKNNVIIIEWPERVEKILPDKATRIKLEWMGENRRKIIIN